MRKTAAGMLLAVVMAAPASAASPTRLAGSCVSIPSVDKPVRLVATSLETYLLFGADGRMPVATYAVDRAMTAQPGPDAEWRVDPDAGGSYAITSARTGRSLTGAENLRLAKTAGCRAFPEAELDTTGRPFKGRLKNGTVYGIADAHMHPMAEFRAGGRVIYGEIFDRFGIAEALGHDTEDHGPDGALDITGNLLRDGLPVGTHGSAGWPSFSAWPTHDTVTHQQLYHRWLQRAWMGGLRLVVAQMIEDQSLCGIEPLKNHSCSETETVKLEVKRLRELQDYIDAQAGGRGRGWLRVVESPRAARRAIERGQLAVVIGIEWSDPFGCSEFRGTPQCTRADIDGAIRSLRKIGVRGVFLAHWTNNALAGAALEGGTRGIFIGAMNTIQTGGFFPTSACPEAGQGEEPVPGLPEQFSPLFGPIASLVPEPLPVYPAGKQCNTLGMTALGEYAVRALMDAHMLIEADHLSERARLQLLKLAEQRRYPIVSSHTNTGGLWTASDLARLRAVGGFATATLDDPGPLATKILAIRRAGGSGRLGVGIGSDTGGFNELPGPVSGPGAKPVAYPFRSWDGKVRFGRQRSGERSFDVNKDGMAHYGLLPDLLASVQQQPGGRSAMKVLFGSAEAYLRMWSLTGDGGQ